MGDTSKSLRKSILDNAVELTFGCFWLDREFGLVWHQHAYEIFARTTHELPADQRKIDTDQAKDQLREWCGNFEHPTLDEGFTAIIAPEFKVRINTRALRLLTDGLKFFGKGNEFQRWRQYWD